MRRFLLALCASSLFLVGCGYHFQGSHNPLKELGIERIYVEQFRNQTYRPGVEQLFASAMIREIQKSRSFRLVNSKEEADAVLSGVITAANSDISSVRKVNIGGGKEVDVAAEFNAVVECNVSLVDGSGRTLFSQNISSNKIHPGYTETGARGATVPLLNESEQRIAIQFVASQMMASVYQRMIDTF